jgi:hypothetical protein
MIPEEVFSEIVNRAKSAWPDDKQMQKYCISEEKEGWNKLQEISFGDLEYLKEDFIKSAQESFEDWNEIFESVNSELSAYRNLLSFSVNGVAQEVIENWKVEAQEEHEGYYAGQLEYLEEKARKHSSILATRQKIDPIKSLLIELEQIFGSECYNGNIQNYGSWGELESEGRKFRYPVKFYTDSGEIKKTVVPPDTPSEVLITGYYAFGANELNIYRALYKAISHLQEKYGLKV